MRYPERERIFLYASVWRSVCADGTTYSRDSFKGMLGGNLRCLLSHDDAKELASTAAGTMVVMLDSFGLLAVVSPPANQLGDSVLAGVCTGQYQGASVRISSDHTSTSHHGRPVELATVDHLEEVSIVGRGFNPSTSVVVDSNAAGVLSMLRPLGGLLEDYRVARSHASHDDGRRAHVNSLLRELGLHRLAHLALNNLGNDGQLDLSEPMFIKELPDV